MLKLQHDVRTMKDIEGLIICLISNPFAGYI